MRVSQSRTLCFITAAMVGDITSPTLQETVSRELQTCSSPLATFTDGTLRKCWPSIAGQHFNAGTVCAEIMNGATDTVRITYDTSGSDYCLREVQAYFGDSIPSTGTGNPQVGQFPAKNTTMPSGCVKTATVTTPLAPRCCTSAPVGLWSNRSFRLAAHSSVVLSNGGGAQTAWSAGVQITGGGSWATFTPAVLNCGCSSAPVPAPVRAPTKVRCASDLHEALVTMTTY